MARHELEGVTQLFELRVLFCLGVFGGAPTQVSAVQKDGTDCEGLLFRQTRLEIASFTGAKSRPRNDGPIKEWPAILGASAFANGTGEGCVMDGRLGVIHAAIATVAALRPGSH